MAYVGSNIRGHMMMVVWTRNIMTLPLHAPPGTSALTRQWCKVSYAVYYRQVLTWCALAGGNKPGMPCGARSLRGSPPQ